jgi:hypothetical protein
VRALELSRAIVAPPSVAIDRAARQRVGHRLVTGVARQVERLPEGEELEITLPLLRRALARPELLLGPSEPFVWQPKFVRRSLGLAVVRACAEGRFRNPAEAVGPVASDAVDEWARTGWKSFYWEPWMAGLSPAARAMVLADAVSWSTTLWTSLDWSVFGPDLRLGAPDDQWVLPVPRRVRLKSRCELRVATVPTGTDAADAASAPPSFVSLAGGTPSPSWSDELAFLALAALRAESRPLPARITGLWPDAGIQRIVELDEHALERAVDRVLEAVATLVKARLSSLALR